MRKKHFFSYSASGFTLIELLVVFTIMAMLSSVSIASYVTYNNNQTFTTSVQTVMSMLNNAKSESLSGIVPSQCVNEQFTGYQVALTPPSNYELDALCEGNTYAITKSVLPTGVTFSSSSTLKVIFQPLNGEVQNQSVIIVSGYGQSNTITISQEGIVSVSELLKPVKDGTWNSSLFGQLLTHQMYLTENIQKQYGRNYNFILGSTNVEKGKV